MVDLWAERELAGGCMGGGACPAGGTRATGGPVKPDTNDRIGDRAYALREANGRVVTAKK